MPGNEELGNETLQRMLEMTRDSMAGFERVTEEMSNSIQALQAPLNDLAAEFERLRDVLGVETEEVRVNAIVSLNPQAARQILPGGKSLKYDAETKVYLQRYPETGEKTSRIELLFTDEESS